MSVVSTNEGILSCVFTVPVWIAACCWCYISQIWINRCAWQMYTIPYSDVNRLLQIVWRTASSHAGPLGASLQIFNFFTPLHHFELHQNFPLGMLHCHYMYYHLGSWKWWLLYYCNCFATIYRDAGDAGEKPFWWVYSPGDHSDRCLSSYCMEWTIWKIEILLQNSSFPNIHVYMA